MATPKSNSPPEPHVRVLFVCLGNYCRSPMADAVFQHMVKAAGLSSQIEVDSAGTGHWHVGDPPHSGTREMLRRNNISYSGARPQINPLQPRR